MINTENKFKIETKEFSLTYPKCNLQDEVLLSYFRVKFDEKIKYAAVVRELHQDGTPHLHAHIQFKKRFCATERSFDFNDFHPNIQKTKNSEQWKKYLEKSGTPVISGLFEIINKNKIKLTNKELLTMDLKQAVDDDIIHIQSLPGILHARMMYESLLVPEGEPIGDQLPSPWVGIDLPVRQIKQKHYWLWSNKPNKGKTTFLKTLRLKYKTGTYNLKEKFQSFRNNMEILLFDEYGKGRSILATDMNSICDGGFPFPAKGKEPVTLVSPLVIVCSNYPINKVYIDDDIIERLLARFTEIDLGDSVFKV